MLEIQRATFDARTRTGNAGIGTSIKKGQIRIVSVAYDAKGKSTVTPLTDWMPLSRVVDALDAL